jgi:hypothetical protein
MPRIRAAPAEETATDVCSPRAHAEPTTPMNATRSRKRDCGGNPDADAKY